MNFLIQSIVCPLLNHWNYPRQKQLVIKVILNHLYFKPTNPFNGLSLTREELLEYNDNEDVKGRLIIFKINFLIGKVSIKFDFK